MPRSTTNPNTTRPLGRRVLACAVGLLVVAACGSSDEGGSNGHATHAPPSTASRPAATPDDSAIEATLRAYTNAATPAAACEHITMALQDALDGRAGKTANPTAPADDDCEAVVAAAVERGDFHLDTAPVDVELVVIDGERAAVRTVAPHMPDGPSLAFLVKTSSAWLVTAEGFVPPDFAHLADEARTQPAGATRLHVHMVDTAFVPSRLTVRRGEPTDFVFTNDGTVAHDAHIVEGEPGGMQHAGGHGAGMDDATDGGVALEPGGTGEVTHVFRHAGTAEVVCHVMGHREAGMTLAVSVL